MEDTQVKENTELIEEMLRDAERAAEPGDMPAGSIVHTGDERLPMPAIVKSLSSAGYVYVYDNRTAERSTVNRNMLVKQLEKRREDGSLVFTTIKPKFKPKRGTLKCLLHGDSPNRAHYDALGLPSCRKTNLTSPYMQEQHMKKRHKQEWAAVEQERLAAEKESDRDFQRSIMKQLADVKTAEPKKETVSRKKQGGK